MTGETPIKGRSRLQGGKDLLASAGLLAASLAFFHPVLSGRMVFLERDLSIYFLPPRLLWVNLVKAHEMPFWNPFSESGVPLLASPQHGVFYPPHLLYLLLPFNLAWNWLIVLHFGLAGIGIYLLARALGAVRVASFAGGVVFMLSGYLISLHSLVTHLFAVAWSPFIMLACLPLLRTLSPRYVVLTALLFSVQFFAGAPEMSLMTWAIILVFTSCAGTFVERRTPLFLRMRNVGLVLAVFLLLSAVQFVPFLELLWNSVRARGLSYEEAVSWSVSAKDLLGFLMPDPLGRFSVASGVQGGQGWLKSLYAGAMPLFLLCVYALSGDRKRGPLLTILLLSVLLSLGAGTPLYRWLYSVPPFSMVRYPAKFLFPLFLVLSLIVGLGFTEFLKRVREEERTTMPYLVSTLFGLAATLLLIYPVDCEKVVGFISNAGGNEWGPARVSRTLHYARRLILFWTGYSALIVFLLKTGRKGLFSCLIAGLLTADLFLMSYGFYFSRSWEWYRHRGAIEECLARDQGSYRYFVTPKTEKSFSYQPVDREIVNNGYGSLFKLYSVGGVETIGLLSYKTFLDALYRSPSLDMGVRYLEMSGAKKLVTGYPLENRMFTALCSKETDGKTAYVYQYEQSPIRAKIYGSAYGVENDAQMVEKVRDPRADPQSTLILLSESKPFSRNKVIESDVRFEEYKPDRVVLTYNADGDGFLYLSDSYYPGWRAYVDEKETRIYRANLAFRAIEVPAGRHRVVFKYVPGSFYCGLFLTIIGILLCGYISWHGKRGKHNA